MLRSAHLITLVKMFIFKHQVLELVECISMGRSNTHIIVITIIFIIVIFIIIILATLLSALCVCIEREGTAIVRPFE